MSQGNPTHPNPRGPAAVVALATLVLSSAAAAQGPRFLIETITVEGARRTSPEIIVSETRLEPGREYSEDEIRDAVHRVNRLPFILDTQPSLRKGSERGAHELVLKVAETKRFFFGWDSTAFRLDEPLALNNDTFFGSESGFTAAAFLGARVFIGSYGLAFVALGPEEGRQLGYTRYRLFGRRFLLSAAWSKGDCCSQVLPLGLDPAVSFWDTFDSERWTLTLGAPLRGGRSIRATVEAFSAERGFRDSIRAPMLFDARFDLRDVRENRAAVTWIDDSSDDALFPTRGRTVTAAIEVRDIRTGQERVLFDFGPPFEVSRTPLPRMRTTLLRFSASRVRHWSISPRQSVSFAARAAIGRSGVRNLAIGETLLADEDFEVWEASGGFRYSLNLRRPGASFPGDLRWESSLDYGIEGTSPSLDVRDNPFERVDLQTGIAYRTSWGVFRFGFSFIDAGDVLR